MEIFPLKLAGNLFWFANSFRDFVKFHQLKLVHHLQTLQLNHFAARHTNLKHHNIRYPLFQVQRIYT